MENIYAKQRGLLLQKALEAGAIQAERFCGCLLKKYGWTPCLIYGVVSLPVFRRNPSMVIHEIGHVNHLLVAGNTLANGVGRLVAGWMACFKGYMGNNLNGFSTLGRGFGAEVLLPF